MKQSKEESQSAHQRSLQAGRLERLLPQLQCGQCGYDGCRPYAQAMAHGVASPVLCVPGGGATATRLAEELGVDASEQIASMPPPRPVQIAQIDPDRCVGCYKCIEACPVDAVVGAHGMLHVVHAEHCTGCELCLEPCPVDCIEMIDAGRLEGDGQLAGRADNPASAAAARRLCARFEAKRQRPSLRLASSKTRESPAELARQAMNRVHRRSQRSDG